MQNKEETPVKGVLIYQPQGAAGEYAKWAINLYHGCSNGCTYCYNRRGVLSHIFGDKPELAAPIVKARDKNINRYMKENNLTAHDAIPQKVIRDTTVCSALSIVAKDIIRIGEDVIREDGGIFFSFTCDPFDPDIDMDILRMIVFVLSDRQIPATILTKNIDWLENDKWKDFWNLTLIIRMISFVISPSVSLSPVKMSWSLMLLLQRSASKLYANCTMNTRLRPSCLWSR